MRTLIVFVAFTLAVLLAAAPAEAACPADADQTVLAVSATDASYVRAAAVAGDVEQHCYHIPCSDGSHSHASCSGHSFVGAHAFNAPMSAAGDDRVAVSSEATRGLTLLPPVPPPLG